jgi:hypothetical protein
MATFRARAPQTTAVIAALSAMAIMASSAQAEGAQRLHARIPAVQPAAALSAVTPSAAGDLCFGPIRPTGDRPVVLAFDRHLSVAMWLDANGLPTKAPSHFKNTQVQILGAAPDAATPSHVTYLFAEGQDPRAQQQTFQQLGNYLATVDLKTVVAQRAGPLAGCQLADVHAYPTPQQPSVGQRIAAAAGQQVAADVTFRVASAATNAVDGALIAGAQHVGIRP